MTDEELIARLRKYGTGRSVIAQNCAAAAARIEALIAEREKDHANINLKADFIDKTINQLAETEAKLAKAAEVLEQCEIMLRLRGHDEVAAIARTTLAEIKGESHDPTT